MLMDGREIVLGGTADARAAGIAVIYQEPTLFPRPIGRGERVHRPSAFAERSTDRLPGDGRRGEPNLSSGKAGVRMDPDRIARGLSIAEQQLVEIAKALLNEAKVLIMDQPTAALSPVEVEQLFRIAETVRADGAAILFISHRLDEVFALCQRVTILRDGKLLLSQKLQEGLTADDLIRGMVGRDLLFREHESTNRAPPSSRLIVSAMRACSRTSRLRSVPERWSRSPDWSEPAAARGGPSDLRDRSLRRRLGADRRRDLTPGLSVSRDDRGDRIRT